jgi:hypothetical protein
MWVIDNGRIDFLDSQSARDLCPPKLVSDDSGDCSYGGGTTTMMTMTTTDNEKKEEEDEEVVFAVIEVVLMSF